MTETDEQRKTDLNTVKRLLDRSAPKHSREELRTALTRLEGQIRALKSTLGLTYADITQLEGTIHDHEVEWMIIDEELREIERRG